MKIRMKVFDILNFKVIFLNVLKISQQENDFFVKL